ncbi:LOW QUALITY PROTEIN: major intrinsically disordered NOTCH2-binding receptor 1-like [Manacus vitellinus]|uniref:LOW QUALITY PROTEIN: major intrinsically disordered NOTCH2-binding receptor 1-like n=1 Tax=Manacus vitellinus TaxID=328815 RepID=UPI000DF0E5B0|nr:LOW QUALITY PROTEIN: major intrinsically disordered NOTCH2-binding receptor 1-like [Manacus vitellinus]
MVDVEISIDMERLGRLTISHCHKPAKGQEEFAVKEIPELKKVHVIAVMKLVLSALPLLNNLLSLVDDISEPDTKQGSDTVSGNCRILLHVINNRKSTHSQEAEAGEAVFVVTLQHRNMDLSVLPNNNHPDKFLQLEVKSLEKSSTCLQASWAKLPDAALPGVQRWHNRIYLQREKRTVTELPGLDLNRVSQEMIDKALGKHITPITLKSTIKRNPLYSDIQVDDDWEEKKKTPSWTVQDYDRHSLHSNLASHIKENPNDLQFWMGDIYTPGYDTLLKKKEREKKHSKYCRIILLMVLAVCILITIVTLSVLLI